MWDFSECVVVIVIFQQQPVFDSSFRVFFCVRCYCTLSSTVCKCHTLPTAQVPSALTDSLSWGHDPFTHACKARPLTVVRWTSLSVIVTNQLDTRRLRNLTRAPQKAKRKLVVQPEISHEAAEAVLRSQAPRTDEKFPGITHVSHQLALSHGHENVCFCTQSGAVNPGESLRSLCDGSGESHQKAIRQLERGLMPNEHVVADAKRTCQVRQSHWSSKKKRDGGKTSMAEGRNKLMRSP